MRFGQNRSVRQEEKEEINAGLPLGAGVLSSGHSEVVPNGLTWAELQDLALRRRVWVNRVCPVV